MGWVLVLGFLAGLALGVKYHREIMSLIGTAEARVATWKQALTEGDRKKGESTDTQGLYDVTEEIRSMGAKDEVQGEGDRESARRYDDATKAFVESGKVKEQADTTANISLEEKRELGEAEKVGKERAKEEDPAVRRDYSKPRIATCIGSTSVSVGLGQLFGAWSTCNKTNGNELHDSREELL